MTSAFSPRNPEETSDFGDFRHEVGKPLVIEEIFPLSAGFEQTEAFLERSKPIVDGWISFYWGKTIDELKAKGDMQGAIVAAWLERFRKLSPQAQDVEKK